MSNTRILLIEDDPDIARVVETYLRRSGFEVEVVYDGPSGLARALAAPPALIVLDLMLPGLDGFELLKRLRPTLATPVIMLTARGEAEDRLQGFEHGADDYVPKPFHPPELVARVKAVLRRAQPERTDERLEVGDLSIDPGKRTVTRAGEALDLTAVEFDLLLVFAANPGRVFRRDDLLDRVWGRDFVGVDRVVDVHVSNLRQKLEPDPGNPRYLLTLRRVGYKFTEAAL
ncbi:MAG: response regulator transcription factor [Deinococcota bacterium]|nr:response regulator transcription factor [Deinococcota bacterium]